MTNSVGQVATTPSKGLVSLITCHKFPGMQPSVDPAAFPCPEYELFSHRNDTPCVTHDEVEACDRACSSDLERKYQWGFSLASALFRVHPQCAAIIAGSEEVGLPCALKARGLGKSPRIYIVTHGHLFSWTEWLSLLPYDNLRFLCLSESICTGMADLWSVPRTQIENAGYGVDTTFFRPMPSTSTAPMILSAGASQRDYRTFLRATSKIRIPIKIAANAGWGGWRPSDIDIWHDRLPSNVDLMRLVDFRALRQLYADASFVVVPLYPARHACGYAVIVEAMAMGKAVIATRTPFSSDFIVDGETGYYVSPGDSDELGNRIGFLLDDPVLAQEMGERGRRRVAQLFSIEAYCQRLERAVGIC
jgi:hypothetical protein